MKVLNFVNKAKDIAKNYKTLYVMGCFGAPMNNNNKARYTTNHAYNKDANRKNKIMRASEDTFGFDCVCLIKGILWGWNGIVNSTYGGASYASNGVPDVDADGIMNYCTGVSTNFSNIIPGELVHMSGHVGIYIGDGLAVECSPIWKDCVQITAVGNIGSKDGYNTRKWVNHGKLKFIDYSDNIPEEHKPENKPTPSSKFNIGDKVILNGKLYTSSNDENSVGNVSNKVTNITRINPGSKHPYNTTGDLGWIDESSISKYIEQKPDKKPESNELEVGDKVKIKSTGNGSSYGSANVAYGVGWTRKVLAIYKYRKYPYMVGDNTGVTGFYKRDALEKLKD